MLCRNDSRCGAPAELTHTTLIAVAIVDCCAELDADVCSNTSTTTTTFISNGFCKRRIFLGLIRAQNVISFACSSVQPGRKCASKDLDTSASGNGWTGSRRARFVVADAGARISGDILYYTIYIFGNPVIVYIYTSDRGGWGGAGSSSTEQLINLSKIIHSIPMISLAGHYIDRNDPKLMLLKCLLLMWLLTRMQWILIFELSDHVTICKPSIYFSGLSMC